MRLVLSTVALAIVYALSLASLDPWDLALGAVLSLGVVVAFRDFLFSEPAISIAEMLRRAVHFPRLVVATAAEIVRGTVTVAWVVLSPRIVSRSGFVAIPDGRRSATGVIISGLLNTLSPGSVLIDVDDEAETWTIHAIDAMDPESLVAEIQEYYDRFQRPVWP